MVKLDALRAQLRVLIDDLEQQGASDIAARGRERVRRLDDEADEVVAAVRHELCRGGGMGSAHDFVGADGQEAIDAACAAVSAPDN